MRAADCSHLLRGFGLARLGVAALLLAVGPALPAELIPDTNRGILALAVTVVVASSGALIAFAPLASPRRIAWLVCFLDIALVTAVVAATGGARSIFAFLYVLSVTAACLLLSRTGGLTIAVASTMLYAGLVFGRTILPLVAWFEAPQETTALEIITIFMNAGTFIVVAIVAGGLAERSHSTQQELENRQADLRDLEAFTNLVFDSVGTGLIAVDGEQRVTALNRAAEQITGVTGAAAVGRPWAVFGTGIPLLIVESEIRSS